MQQVFVVYKHRAGYLAVEKICRFPLQRLPGYLPESFCQVVRT